MTAKAKERVHVIATQHLDVAWLWQRVAHGEELMRQCFQRAVEMIESWPEHHFVFSRSTAWSFWVLEQRDPELFRKACKYVKSGQLELCGGEWVEPDHLMPDGESLVRQCVYGQRYFLDRFGKMATVSWDPDIFGHSGSFPQISARSGLGGFYSHRCRPASEQGLPEHQFRWQGTDGSVILFLSGMWVNRPDPDVVRKAVTEMRSRGYPATHVVTGLRSDRRITMQVDWVPVLEQSETDSETAEVLWSSAGAALDDMRAYQNMLPTVKGELGFQFTGTYTSNGAIKRYNRKLEALLLTAEMASSAASLLGHDYAQGQFSEAWRQLCVNQFHDICCGCCYEEAHQEAIELFHEIERRGEWLLERALGFMAAQIATSRGGFDRACLVFSSLSWPVESVALLRSGSEQLTEVVSGEGNVLPSQQVTLQDGSKRLLFQPVHANGVGFSVYHLRAAEKRDFDSDLIVGDTYMENSQIRVEIDPDSGALSRVYDKQMGKELLAKGGKGNRLVYYEDRTPMEGVRDQSWQPWKIGYTGRSWQADKVSVEVIERGPVRCCIRVTSELGLASDLPKTRITQDVILYANSRIVHFDSSGEWHAREVLLKAEFDLNLACEVVTAESPYGVAVRPGRVQAEIGTAGADSMAEDGLSGTAALIEPDRPMQKWLDVSDGRNGIAFLNNGKYGYDTADDTVRLSLLRSPVMRVWKDEVIGLGHFEFSYALMPHSGDWRNGQVPRRAYEFNRPLIAWETDVHEGIEAPLLVACQDRNVMVTAVKHTEGGTGLVVRVVETAGQASRATIRFGRKVARVQEADLLERSVQDSECAVLPSGELETDGAQVLVSVTPYEIKTLIVHLVG